MNTYYRSFIFTEQALPETLYLHRLDKQTNCSPSEKPYTNIQSCHIKSI